MNTSVDPSFASSTLRPARLARWTLLATLALLGVNAVVAGALFVAKPDGRLLGIDATRLQGSAFADYLVPGLALLALGAVALFAAVLVGRRARSAWIMAEAASVGFLFFEAIQVSVIGTFWLQAVVVALALLCAVLAAGMAPMRRKAEDW